MTDMINHPPHYTAGKIEVIEFIEDQQLGFHEGNAIKYVARAKLKGSELENLAKARWYLDRRIQQLAAAGVSAQASGDQQQNRGLMDSEPIEPVCVECGRTIYPDVEYEKLCDSCERQA